MAISFVVEHHTQTSVGMNPDITQVKNKMILAASMVAEGARSLAGQDCMR